MAAQRDPDGVARERVVDAARRAHGRIDHVAHADVRRVDELVSRIQQAQREIPALVPDEERRPVAAGGHERLAATGRRALEDVVGHELRVRPAVGIARVTPVAARQHTVGTEDREVHDGRARVTLERGHATCDVLGRGEQHVVVQREHDLALGRAHALVACGRGDVGGQRDEVDVRELVADHLLRPVGGRVVDREDLEWRVALAARGLERAAERVAALVVQDRDRDRGAHRCGLSWAPGHGSTGRRGWRRGPAAASRPRSSARSGWRRDRPAARRWARCRSRSTAACDRRRPTAA